MRKYLPALVVLACWSVALYAMWALPTVEWLVTFTLASAATFGAAYAEHNAAD